jgi:hypothetical protein
LIRDRRDAEHATLLLFAGKGGEILSSPTRLGLRGRLRSLRVRVIETGFVSTNEILLDTESVVFGHFNKTPFIERHSGTASVVPDTPVNISTLPDIDQFITEKQKVDPADHRDNIHRGSGSQASDINPHLFLRAVNISSSMAVASLWMCGRTCE